MRHNLVLRFGPISLTIGKQQALKQSSFTQSLAVEFPLCDRDFPFSGDVVVNDIEDVLALLI